MIILIPEDHFSMYHTALFEGKFWVASALDYLQDSHAEKSEILRFVRTNVFYPRTKHRLFHMVAMLACSAGGRVLDEYEGTSLAAIRLMAATCAVIAILPQIYAMTEARRTKRVLIRHLKDSDARRSITLIQPHSYEPRADSTALAEVLLSAAAHFRMRLTG